MAQLNILPPEKLKAKARAKVRKFQLEKKRAEVEGKLNPRKKAPSWKLYFLELDKYDGDKYCGEVMIKEGVELKLDDIVDGKAFFTITGKGGSLSYYQDGYSVGSGFEHGAQRIVVAAINNARVQVQVRDPGDSAEESGVVNITPEEQKKLNDTLLEKVKKKDKREVKRLLDAGADVEAIDEHKETALMVAACYGYTEIVQMLLEAGADMNVERADRGNVLINAADVGHKEIVQMLLEAGADVNAKNDAGATALMRATLHGHTETAQVLVDVGADLNAKNDYGATALDYAEDSSFGRGKAETIEFLKSQGAKRGEELQ